MGTERLRLLGCIFAENGPVKYGPEASFIGTGFGAKSDLRWILSTENFRMIGFT